MILITGATGKVGSEVVKSLVRQGVKFRALVRDPAKAVGLKGNGVEIVQGDMDNPDSLAPALKGVETAFLLSSPSPHSIETQGNLITAAWREGVRRIVKLSALGSSPNSPSRLLRQQGEIDKRLQDSGLRYVILRPHFFMQNTLGMFPASIASDGAIYIPLMKDARISLVDVRDIAAVAATVILDQNYDGKTLDITGPEALSFPEMARKISLAVDNPVKCVDVPHADARKSMLAMGMDEWMTDGFLELFSYFSKGLNAQITNVIRNVAGKEPITFDQFAKEYANAFFPREE